MRAMAALKPWIGKDVVTFVTLVSARWLVFRGCVVRWRSLGAAIG